MSQSETVSRLLPTIMMMARRPGKAVLILASLVLAIYTLASVLLLNTSHTFIAFLPLATAVVAWIAVGTFAWYRARINQQLPDRSTSRDLAAPAGASNDGLDARYRAEAEALGSAYQESRIHTVRFLPRIEAAQRALLRAAGGPVQAPYLRYDMRWVLLSFLGTIAAIPLALAGSAICFLALLLHHVG